MPATTNSTLSLRAWMALALWMLSLMEIVAQTTGATPISSGILRSNSLRALAVCREAIRTNASNSARIELAKEAFFFGDVAKDAAEREAVALEGIEASRAVLQNTNLAAGNYYLALNLGQLARTRSLTALSLVKQMEVHFKEAISLDAKYDHAGALRHLGELDFEAPGWPISIGSRTLARTFIEKAVATDPDYPENPLLNVEALVRWGEYAKARVEIKSLEALFAKAQASDTNHESLQVWADWHMRLNEIQQKLIQAPSP